GDLTAMTDKSDDAIVDELAADLSPTFARWLGRNPALEDVTRITQRVAQATGERRLLRAGLEPAAALAVKEAPLAAALHGGEEFLGVGRRTFGGEVLKATDAERLRLWREGVTQFNWELFDRGVEAFTWAALESVGRAARERNALGDAALTPVY